MLVLQVCLKWNVQRGIPVIPRSQNPKNIRANIDGIFDWVLPRAAKVHFATHAFDCPKSGIACSQLQVAKLVLLFLYFFFRHMLCGFMISVEVLFCRFSISLSIISMTNVITCMTSS